MASQGSFHCLHCPALQCWRAYCLMTNPGDNLFATEEQSSDWHWSAYHHWHWSTHSWDAPLLATAAHKCSPELRGCHSLHSALGLHYYCLYARCQCLGKYFAMSSPHFHSQYVDPRVTQCSPTWDKPTKQTQISMGMTRGFATHFNKAKSLQVGLFQNIILARVSLHRSNNDTQYQWLWVVNYVIGNTE